MWFPFRYLNSFWARLVFWHIYYDLGVASEEWSESVSLYSTRSRNSCGNQTVGEMFVFSAMDSTRDGCTRTTLVAAIRSVGDSIDYKLSEPKRIFDLICCHRRLNQFDRSHENHNYWDRRGNRYSDRL